MQAITVCIFIYTPRLNYTAVIAPQNIMSYNIYRVI